MGVTQRDVRKKPVNCANTDSFPVCLTERRVIHAFAPTSSHGITDPELEISCDVSSCSFVSDTARRHFRAQAFDKRFSRRLCRLRARINDINLDWSRNDNRRLGTNGSVFFKYTPEKSPRGSRPPRDFSCGSPTKIDLTRAKTVESKKRTHQRKLQTARKHVIIIGSVTQSRADARFRPEEENEVGWYPICLYTAKGVARRYGYYVVTTRYAGFFSDRKIIRGDYFRASRLNKWLYTEPPSSFFLHA